MISHIERSLFEATELYLRLHENLGEKNDIYRYKR